VIVLEETAGPQAVRPRVTLPTTRRPVAHQSPRRGILPALKSAVRPKATPIEEPYEPSEVEHEVERTGT